MKNRQHWSSRYVFLLAAIGSAVGLGNIWKFPYIVGEHGGGAFILVYLLCITLVGIPVLIAEVFIGKTAQANPVAAFTNLAIQVKASRFWVIFGYLGVLTGFLILSFYSVVAGWSLEYLSVFLQNSLLGFDAKAIEDHFLSVLASAPTLLLWHSIFMVLTVIIVGRGIKSGIEKMVGIAMPLLFIILIILVIYATQLDSFAQTLHYFLDPDFSKLNTQAVLIALGHAFFTLSLGMGAMMIYGSYLQKNTPIVRLSFGIAIMDTLVALLSGLAIFPLIFAHHLEPSSGPSLLFISLPNALLALPFGQFFGIAFFFLLLIAAISSAVSILEPVVAYLVQKTQYSRGKIVSMVGAIIWLIGIGVLLSFNHWSEVKILGNNIFDSLDYLTANILLPLGGLGIALFATWILDKNPKTSIGMVGIPHKIWWLATAFLAPVAIITIAYNGLI